MLPLTPLPHIPITSPLHDRMQDILSRPAPAGWAPTGLTREYYLDLMEPIVRAAAGWQDASGAIIDPVAGVEAGQTSPRYAAPGAILLAYGRVPELRESICHTMDYACRRLAGREAASPDFWMRELMTAYLCLAPLEPARAERWAADLRCVDPERTYKFVKPDGQGLETLHNWTVYAAAGEWLRETAGLAGEGVSGRRFLQKYLPPQLCHFSAEGMYRDPGDPITYDITTRLQVAVALAGGYDGPASAELHHLLQRAGLATLLFVTPQGYAPYGGRSSQFQFQEAILAALCELEAGRYRESDPRLAGAFKRQAHRSVAAVERWLTMTPFRHIKNGFPPEANFGRDEYGNYSVYSLLAASFLGLAALYADDTIPEAPCPAEIGGYVFTLPGAFHKLFATAAGMHLEVDLRADLRYDATGLGRLACDGVPLELGPGMPFTSTPHYKLPAEHLPAAPVAIGPSWRTDEGWVSLAGLSEGLQSEITIEDESPERVACTITYHHGGTVVEEAYTLTSGRVDITARAGAPIRYHVPLLVTDGDAESTITLAPGQATVAYRGSGVTVQYAPDLVATLEDARIANRNGLYRVLTIEGSGKTVALTLTLAPPAT